MKRGEVYWADLEPRSGSEQKGRRPVIIISHDGFNLTPGWRSVIVVPLSTSRAQAARGLSVVPIPHGAANLPRDCFAICHQVTTLDRNKISTRIGELTPTELIEVESGLKAAMDLN
jgi:mRNA-degrading endonuclease toxin of MazEF toxin-antitoxin module